MAILGPSQDQYMRGLFGSPLMDLERYMSCPGRYPTYCEGQYVARIGTGTGPERKQTLFHLITMKRRTLNGRKNDCSVTGGAADNSTNEQNPSDEAGTAGTWKRRTAEAF